MHRATEFDQAELAVSPSRVEGGGVDEAWLDSALNAACAEGAAGAPGAVVAILAVVTETTARVRGEQALEVEPRSACSRRPALASRLGAETDAWVREEMSLGLSR